MSSTREKLRVVLNDSEVFGALATARRIVASLLTPNHDQCELDRRFGTDTDAWLSNRDGGIPSHLNNEVQRYEPAAEAVVQHILKRLPIEPKNFVFLDVGCGKGRVLLLAAQHAYKRVVGVELSPVTSDIARRNIDIVRTKARGRFKCNDIGVLTENALDFDIPDANLVVFLYNPFQGSIFESFMKRLYDFRAKHREREVYVAYLNPWFCQGWLERSGLFRKVYEHRVILPKWSWNLWVPNAGGTE